MDKPKSLEDLGGYKGVKMVHCNIRSLVKKIDQVKLLVEGSGIDIITISETWLKQHLNTSLFNLEGYYAFRQDRNQRLKPGKRGGGLICYVSHKHASSCEILSELDKSNDYIEAQWLYIHRQHCKDMVICNIYRPPKGDLRKAITYLDECLQTLNVSKTDLFILGDLNINYKNKSSPEYKKFNFFAQSNSLTQYINSTTRNTDKTKSLLDLAITNSKFVSHAGTLDLFISDHQPIYIIHKKGRDIRQSVEFEGRSYRNFDAVKFKELLLGLNWEGYYTLTDTDKAWAFIIDNITAALDIMCPVRTFHIKNYRPDWMTRELIEQVKDRDYFYKKAKTSGDRDAWNVARYLRNVTNSNIRQAKREFVLDELRHHDDNPKKFWKVIRKIVPSDKTVDSRDILLKHDGVKLDKNKVAHFINDYFINVGNFKRTNSQSYSSDECIEDHGGPQLESLSEVLEKDVFKIVKDINIAKSSGLGNISSFIVKEAFKILIPEVTYMYNLSIQTAVFPAAWKQALVIPIPKSGNLSMVQNYRPISLLPLPGKILEKLIHQQLTGYLDSESLLSAAQHGFRKGHSTIHSVAQLTEYVSKKLDTRQPTLAAYVDFRKAFDCVQHPILINKLAQLGIGKGILDWVKSYLSDRQQKVLANNIYSAPLTIMQGVPQGSILGPLFYIIYANDLSKIVSKCGIALYADDTVLYTANDNFAKSVQNLQDDIDSLNVWCTENGIRANTEKTKVMVFGTPNMLHKGPVPDIELNGELLQVVSTYKYLGITLDTRLSYNVHVSKTIANVTAKLKQFKRMRNFLNAKAALMVYKNMMLPILEYGDVFLTAASVTNKKKLQILQNKCLRCALGKDVETSIIDLHAEANLFLLKYRREQHLLNFMYDQAQNPDMLKRKTEYAIRTRSSKKKLLRVKRPYSEKFKRSLAYMGPKKWNQLSEELHHAKSKNLYKLLVGDMIKSKAARFGQESFGTGNDFNASI